jgi:oligopeptide/dipeptide ABC transporter ATP-binding protein
MPDEPVLSIRNLSVDFDTSEGVLHAVDDISFDLYPGEILGLVGESGSGKSVTVMSMLRLLPEPPARIAGGKVNFAGRGDLLKLSSGELRRIRGKEIGIIFQDPMTSLNPVLTIGFQVAEAITLHQRRRARKSAHADAARLLELVELPGGRGRARQYPHQYSGGMRQRAMIAMSIANQPRVIIADEPTTALDVTVQAHVLEVLQKVQKQTRAGTILITHDLGVVAELADRVVVMYAGRIVEIGDVHSIFHEPRHPYTIGLLKCLPRIGGGQDRLEPIRGQPPSLLAPPSGCAFHPRCALYRGRAKCREERPSLWDITPRHRSACHFHAEVGAASDRLAEVR